MGQADVKLVVYTPLDSDRTAEKLDALLAAPTAIESRPTTEEGEPNGSPLSEASKALTRRGDSRTTSVQPGGSLEKHLYAENAPNLFTHLGRPLKSQQM
jgi:hypothetical protein